MRFLSNAPFLSVFLSHVPFRTTFPLGTLFYMEFGGLLAYSAQSYVDSELYLGFAPFSNGLL